MHWYKFVLAELPCLVCVIGWFTILFWWVIPTFSITFSNIGSLTIWHLIALLLFFLVWLPITGFALIMLVMFLALD